MAGFERAIQELKRDRDWQGDHAWKESHAGHRDAQRKSLIGEALRIGKSEQFGIDLNFVFGDVEQEFRRRTVLYGWRADREGNMTEGCFMMQNKEKAEAEWQHSSQPAQPPANPNFLQIAPIMSFGEHSLGRGHIFPRDGRPHSSIVDGILHRGSSAPATRFLSWAWSYKWDMVQSALERWKQQQLRMNPHFDSINIYLWWCFL